MIEKRAGEANSENAKRWAAGLRRDAKENWRQIKTAAIIAKGGLTVQSNEIKTGGLTSKPGCRIVHDQDAAEEVGKYAVRLNAQSWEKEGLDFDVVFASVYISFQGWRGVVQDRKAIQAEDNGSVLNSLLALCSEDVSEPEVDMAIDRTKTNKASGSDETKNEHFRYLDVMGRRSKVGSSSRIGSGIARLLLETYARPELRPLLEENEENSRVSPQNSQTNPHCCTTTGAYLVTFG